MQQLWTDSVESGETRYVKKVELIELLKDNGTNPNPSPNPYNPNPKQYYMYTIVKHCI